MLKLCAVAVCLIDVSFQVRAADGGTARGALLAQTKSEHNTTLTVSPSGNPAEAATSKPSDTRKVEAKRIDAPLKESRAEDAEQKVLDFVRAHQPKLIKLLEFLEKNQPTQYTQALKEMFRSQQRLEALSKRDPELHAVELQLWQIRSELRLLAAEMAVASHGKTGKSSQDANSQDLTELVQKEAMQELSRLHILKARAAQGLSRLDAQIEALSKSQEEQIARNVKLWQNRISKQSRQ